MFCSKCGKSAATDAQFCASCGAKLVSSQQVQSQPFTQSEPAAAAFNMPPMQIQKSKSGLGFGIAGLVLGILALAYGFSDYAAVTDGSYSYILYEEIGILAILSILGIVFGGVSTSRKSPIGMWGLVLSTLALLFTFFLSQYT